MCAFPSPVLCTHRLECEAVLSLPLQVHLVPSHSISVTLESFFLSFSPEGLSRAVYPQLASFSSESRAAEHEGKGRRAGAEAWGGSRVMLTCSGAVLLLILLRQLWCSSLWAFRLVWHCAVGLCLGLCSCACVLECHPCSGSCFHPSIAAPWRAAGCKAAAQKCSVSSPAQPHSCHNHSLGACGATVDMSGSQRFAGR